MARWKARVEFLLSVVELLFLSLTVEALQGKTSLLSGGVGQFEAKFQGKEVVPIFCFLENYRHILLSDSANCTMLRAVVLTQYWRVTEKQMDGQMDNYYS